VREGTRVVVTGLGVVNAAGLGVDAFWAAVLAGESQLAPVRRFDASGFPVRVAGEVTATAPADLVPRRFRARTDRFTHLALVAADEALRDAGMDLDGVDRDRAGVWFGNTTGGWDLCERGFAEYYGQGADMVNPWQATGWFLAAPQGFLTIRHGLRGASKSFSGDRASGAVALHYGARSIAWGRTDVVLAGGCEAPVSPLALLCLHAGGDLTGSDTYRPFDRAATGLAAGEGAAVLVLEEGKRARRRGARVYGEVLGAAHGTCAAGDAGRFARLIAQALGRAGCGPDDVDLVLAEGCGSPTADRFEAEAIAAALAGRRRPVPVAAPKAVYGHLYGASFGTDVVCGLLAARDGVAPPTPGFEAGDLPGLVEVSAAARPAAIDRFLVTSHSRYGSCVAMVFGGCADG